MIINLVLDKTKLLESSDALVINNETEYFISYGVIKKAIRNNKDITVITYSVPVFRWLENAFIHYKSTTIKKQEISFKDLLAKKWKITYDVEISDSQIINEKLLELPIEGERESMPFSNFICENFISPHINSGQVTKSKFGELINDLVEFENQKDSLPKIIRTVYELKIRNFIKQNPNDKILSIISEDINKAYELVSTYKLILSYPENIQANCLSKEILQALRDFKPTLSELKINNYIQNSLKFKKNILPELSIFYKNLVLDNQDSIAKALSFFSGLLKEEFEFISQILKNNPQLISNNIISQLQSKFSKLAQIDSNDFLELKELIQPNYPSDFRDNFNTEEAITWATKEYLPYKFWMDNAKIIDDKLMQNGKIFSEYLFENYESISYQYNNNVYRFIFNNKEIIKSNDVVIILILDNFNYRHIDYLKSSLANYKFAAKSIDPYLSLLPSETGISKFSLLSGKRDKIDSKALNYESTINNTWQEYFPNHKLSYLNKIGDLNNYKIAEKEIIFINYLEIDKELHKASEKTAKEHREWISFLISGITKTIDKFCRSNNTQNKTKVFFISDHGSTLINKNIPNDIDVKYFKDFKFDISHRYLGLDDKEYIKFKENKNINDSLHFLDRRTSGDETNYIIAKGYNRFIDIQEEFYVHGGVLPEEVIIPGGYFEYAPSLTAEIILQLKKSEYRLLVKEMSVWRIANPNQYNIEDIFIECTADDTILFQHSIKELNSNCEELFNKEMRIQDENAKNIKVKLSYRNINIIHNEEILFPVQIRKMVQSKFDFDNF